MFPIAFALEGGGARPAPEERRAQAPTGASPVRRAAGEGAAAPTEAPGEAAATGSTGAGLTITVSGVAAALRPERPEARPAMRASDAATPTDEPTGEPGAPPVGRLQTSEPGRRAARPAGRRLRPADERRAELARKPATDGRCGLVGSARGGHNQEGASAGGMSALQLSGH